MATATRTAVKTRKTLEALTEQVDRMEQMLLLMMTKKQREEYDALLAEQEPEVIEADPDPEWDPILTLDSAEEQEAVTDAEDA